jgi:hypothetical protein
MSIAAAFGEEESPETELPQGEQAPLEQAEKPEPTEPAGAPPAPDAETKHVPLAALEAERRGRQDWKEKAIRFEEETKQLRERLQERPQEPQQPRDPLVSLHETVVNERFNTSEMLARDKHADLDEVVQVFMDAAAKNPALSAQLQNERHPWEFAYQEGKRLKFAAEIGNDPAAYRARLEAEIRASLQPAAPAAPAAAPLPQSLAGARSAGARGTTFTGPTPFESLFPN